MSLERPRLERIERERTEFERIGGCLCGAVRFKATLTGTSFGVCHCPMCRKWTGLALLGMTVPAANVAWRGAEHIELPIGSLDDSNGLTMTNEIYIDHKPDSYAFAGAGRNVLTGADCVARFPLLASESADRA